MINIDKINQFQSSNEDDRYNYSEELENVLKALSGLSRVIFEVIGNWVWISGETREHKNALALKELGCKWAAKKKQWFYRPEEHKSRFNRKEHSIDEIQLHQDEEHCIKLMNPILKNYSIVARKEKDRIMIYGSVDYYHYRYGKLAKCSVSLTRNASAIAQDIKRKILITAVDEIRKANEYRQKEEEKKEQKRILKGMLAQQVKLESYHNAITGMVASSGVRGRVKEGYDGYNLKLYKLTTDQLIKIVGFVSTL